MKTPMQDAFKSIGNYIPVYTKLFGLVQFTKNQAMRKWSSFFRLFSRSSKQEEIDEFDKRFGFILKHQIDSKKNYQNVKKYYKGSKT